MAVILSRVRPLIFARCLTGFSRAPIIAGTTGELPMLRTLEQLAVIVSCIVAAPAVSAVYAQTSAPNRVPQWTKVAPFPIPEEELYGSVVNGKFYVLGGFGIGGMAPGLVFEYDPASDRWTRKKDMPIKVHHQAQTPLNGKLYVFGGCLQGITGEGGTTNAWEWDPVADSWRALAPLTSNGVRRLRNRWMERF